MMLGKTFGPTSLEAGTVKATEKAEAVPLTVAVAYEAVGVPAEALKPSAGCEVVDCADTREERARRAGAQEKRAMLSSTRREADAITSATRWR